MIREFVDEVLSGDRVIYSFVVIWAIAGAVWITLDWLGNPNRGRFHPKGDRYEGSRGERREARRRQKAEDDAAVRATLRDAYGASSLRLSWTKAREAAAIDADEELVRPDPRPPLVAPRPPSRLGIFNEAGAEPLLGTYGHLVQLELPKRHSARHHLQRAGFGEAGRCLGQLWPCMYRNHAYKQQQNHA